jgi:4-oxalocrotonate tautomerase
MPLIQVSMLRGRTDDEKRAMLEAISQAVHDSIGAPVPSIRVWIHEMGPYDMIAGGEVLADRASRAVAP